MTELSPQPLVQMLQGYQATAILRTALRLGVFDALAAGPATAVELAPRVGAAERGTRILLDGAAALGLLTVAGDAFALSPTANAFLVADRPGYVGRMADLLANEWQWESYGRLEDAVRAGGTVLDQHAETPGHAHCHGVVDAPRATVLDQHAETPGHSWRETFAPSSEGFAGPASEQLADVLDSWASGRESLNVLDVACGSGLYSLTFAGRHEHARVTLLDWPNVLAVTRENVEACGLTDRVDYLAGSMFDVPLGGPYDLVVTSHVLHHFSETRCIELLNRLAVALAPDGRLAINDFMPGDGPPVEDPFPHLFSVRMLVWSREGEAYPVAAYDRMLAAAALRRLELQATTSGSRILIARPA